MPLLPGCPKVRPDNLFGPSLVRSEACTERLAVAYKDNCTQTVRQGRCVSRSQTVLLLPSLQADFRPPILEAIPETSSELHQAVLFVAAGSAVVHALEPETVLKGSRALGKPVDTKVVLTSISCNRVIPELF